MSPARERVIAILVVATIAIAGIVTLVLLADARNSGVEALEASQTSEVLATARTLDARQANQISGAGPLLRSFGLDFTRDGGDQEQLDSLLELFGGSLKTGFFLVNTEGTITAAVNMPGGPRPFVGTTYERPGYSDLIARPGFCGGILPVGDGLSTDVPTTAVVYPVRNDVNPDKPCEGPIDGYFVLENAVTPDDLTNLEIAQLPSAETDVWRFVDSDGTVIASSRPGEVAEPLNDPQLRDLPEGFHRLGDRVAVSTNLRTSGWQVIFTQSADEFQEALAGPLQDVGILLVIVLLGMGVVISVMLVRQLRNARAEQRRLRELAEAQEEFVSIVSHELRTPVAGVLGFLQTGLDHWDALSGDERRHTVTRAMSSARRLQALTRDVLDAQSVETGTLTYAFDDVDLRDEVATAVTAAQAVHEHRRFEMELPTSPVHVRADADRLQQVLTNLLDNAHNNSPPDLPIVVSLEPSGTSARVMVRDQGPGLDPESAERIFEKFVRGRSSSVTGTGLGLYVSRRIVEAHDGRIWVESSIDEGARFIFELPMVPSGAVQAPGAPVPNPS